MTWVYFMRQKSEVFTIFKKWQSLVERQSGCYVKVLRSDRGGEYNSNEFEKFCENIGLDRQLTVGYTPQQNGVAERKNRTIEEMAKLMLHEKGLPRAFWAEAVYTAVYLINRCPTKAVENQTPFEAWSGRKPSVNHLKVFGCICYAHVPMEKRHKLDETSEKCIFVGYSTKSKGYRVYSLKSNKVIVSRDVIFNEKAAWDWKFMKEQDQAIIIEEDQQNAPRQSESDEELPLPSQNLDTSSSSSTPSSSSTSSLSSTPRKMKSLGDIYQRCNFCIVEPENFEAAIKEEAWKKAMVEEINVIEKKKT